LIVVSGYGIDTSGARAIFTQNGTPVAIGSSCSESGPDYGVAALFTVPSTLQPGTVTVQLTTTVNGSESGVSNALTLTVWPSPAGGALQFDGVDDVATVPHNTSLSLTNFTIEGWVKIDSYDFMRYPIVSKGGQNFGNYTFSLLGNQTLATPGSIELAYAGQQFSNWSCGGGQVPLSTWTHVAVTFSNLTCTIYVNAVPGAPLSPLGEAPTPNTDPLLLGRVQFPGVYESFAGAMDEVRVWNVARSSADIGANYNKIVLGTSQGLVGYWQFDEAGGTLALDSSGNGNNGTFGAGTAAPNRVVSGAPIIR
jgi:hypothetical protein